MDYSNSSPKNNESLVFAKVAIELPLLSADTTYLVRVDEELRWSLSCHGLLVEVDQCSVLATIPHTIASAGALLHLLHTLEETQICCGNPASDFKSLVEARDGIFKDSSGVCVHYLSLYCAMGCQSLINIKW